MDCAKSAGYNGIKYNSSKDNVTYDLVLFYPEKAKVKAVGKPSIELFLDNIPSVVQGDKRVLLLDGHVLGTIRRVPMSGDIRANIHVGGRVERADLSAEEQVMVEAVGQRLRKVGLFFVGLDVINGKLIEINVTSPTGIQELGRLTNTAPEDRVIEWVEERAKAF